MFGLTNKDLFAVIWIGIWLAILLYSLSTYGYMVWFKPEEFIKLYEEKKKKTPRWFRFFMKSNTTIQDLWAVRIIYAVLCIMLLTVFVILVLQLM